MEHNRNKPNCPFCSIERERQRIIVKEKLVVAFPTNLPIVPGHTLVCPIRHVVRIDELLQKELQSIKNTIVRIKKGLKKALGAQGFNIAWNEGQAAGQSVAHMHIHIVPRRPSDKGIYSYEPRKFLYRPGSRKQAPDKELEEVAAIIKNNL